MIEKNEDADPYAGMNDRQIYFLLATHCYTLEERKTIMRRMRSGLSDDEWHRIAVFAQCNDRALLFDINKLAKIYWDDRIDQWIPTQIAENVSELLKKTQDLKRELKRTSNDPNFYKGIFLEHKRSPTEYSQGLETSFEDLSRLESLLIDAHDRLVHPSPQPTYGPISAALRHVDFVAHRHHEGGISFSKKKPFGINFILELFRLIDSKVKQSYIESLLKEYLKKRIQWGGIEQLVKQESN